MLAVAAVGRPDDAAAFSFPASALTPSFSCVFLFKDLCGNTAGLFKAAFGARTALPDASVSTRDFPLASISHTGGRVVASDNACRCRALWMLRDESSKEKDSQRAAGGHFIISFVTPTNPKQEKLSSQDRITGSRA